MCGRGKTAVYKKKVGVSLDIWCLHTTSFYSLWVVVKKKKKKRSESWEKLLECTFIVISFTLCPLVAEQYFHKAPSQLFKWHILTPHLA